MDVTSRVTTFSRSKFDGIKPQHIRRVTRKTDFVAKALGKRVRALRTALGWSQERLAEEAGMHRTYMWGIEQGTRNPSLRHLARLASALGVPLHSLFDEL